MTWGHPASRSIAALHSVLLVVLAATAAGCASSQTSASGSSPSRASERTEPTLAVAGATAATVPARSTTVAAPSSSAAVSRPASPALRLVAAARTQVGVTTGYDPAYSSIAYPGGDVAPSTGVCSDVVIRALRGLGIDLQVRVHEDMQASFSAYPTTWGLQGPDANIDHRRVANLATYFERRGYKIDLGDDPEDYHPGDIVTFKIPLDHIGIVSDRAVDGRPLVIHNAGAGTLEEDVLFRWKRIGHYRVLAES